MQSVIQKVAFDAASLAKRAGELGTFAVGGVLISDTGQVLARARNRVLVNGKLNDPTAHVERQLVDWVYDQRAARGDLALPPNGQLIVVSSLEPCMMCAGALLTSGIRCVAIAEDDFAGVGIAQACVHLPEALRGRGAEIFSLFSVKDRRAAVGKLLTGAQQPLNSDLLEMATSVFEDSLENVRKAVGRRSNFLSDVHAALNGDDTIALDLQRTARTWVSSSASEQKTVRAALAALRRNGNDPFAALVAESGSVLCASIGELNKSPIRTAVAEVVRAYSVLQKKNAPVAQTDPASLTLVWDGAYADQAQTVSSLGAIGSFLEGPLPQGRSPFINATSVETLAGIEAVLSHFPKFYRDFVRLSAAGP